MGGPPGSETKRENKAKTGRVEYKIELYENKNKITLFQTQAEFAIPIIRAEAKRSLERHIKESPDKEYELKELF